MITGELKNKIDSLWDVFAAGGLVNPLDVIELSDVQFRVTARVLFRRVRATFPIGEGAPWAKLPTISRIKRYTLPR